jgi:hypothetical protein
MQPCGCSPARCVRCAAGGGMFGVDEVRGGSPYGAGTYAGATGARQPSEVELETAVHQVGAGGASERQFAAAAGEKQPVVVHACSRGFARCRRRSELGWC